MATSTQLKQTMNWLSNFFSSTIGRKVVMALTGLFLILFLVVHLIGNLQLLKSDEGQAFNLYSKFMTSNPLIITISVLNFTFIAIHIIWAALLTRRNRAARGPVSYAVNRNSSTLTSRNMGILGTLVLIFLVIHLKGFGIRLILATFHWLTTKARRPRIFLP